MNDDGDEEKISYWEIGLVAISAGFILVLLLAIPWSYYYKNVLLWEEGPGTALVLAVIAIFNCLSLFIRINIIDQKKINYRDLTEYQAAMACSNLGNILFWLGLAMWLVFKELNLPRLLCYLIASSGASFHVYLHLERYKKSKKSNQGILLAVYVVVLFCLSWAYFTGAGI